MPDLGPNKRAVRLRPVMVATRGYDPTQPNKTSFFAPPATFVSTDPNFIYSGMCVRRLANGTTVPAVASDFTGSSTGRPQIANTQVGWAFQDSNRFDIVQAGIANNLSVRSDLEIRTGWFDRTQVYAIDAPLTLGTTPGEITLAAGTLASAPIIGRVSRLAAFEGGNPAIGGVNYSYLSTLPVPGTTSVAPVLANAATLTNADYAVMNTFTAALNAWVIANGVTSPGTFQSATILHADTGPPTFATESAAFLSVSDPTAFPAAVAYAATMANLRQAASNVSSLQAIDNSMLTFVTTRG